MRADLRSEKTKREQMNKDFDKLASGMTFVLLITLFMIILYTIFWSVL